MLKQLRAPKRFDVMAGYGIPICKLESGGQLILNLIAKWNACLFHTQLMSNPFKNMPLPSCSAITCSLLFEPPVVP